MNNNKMKRKFNKNNFSSYDTQNITTYNPVKTELTKVVSEIEDIIIETIIEEIISSTKLSKMDIEKIITEEFSFMKTKIISRLECLDKSDLNSRRKIIEVHK